MLDIEINVVIDFVLPQTVTGFEINYVGGF